MTHQQTPTSASIPNLQQAIGWHQQGQLAQAEAVYRQILQIQPDHAEAMHMLGVIALQTGHLQSAVDLIGQALAINPHQAEAYSNIGVALQNLQRYGEALACLDRALQLSPGHVDALNNRGNVLRDLARWEEALASYDMALQISPDDVAALKNRGMVLMDMKLYNEALKTFGRLLFLTPQDAAVLNFRGTILKELNRYEEALASYDQSLRINPEDAEAHNNRGAVLNDQNRFEEALESYNQALRIKSDLPEVYYNRGNALRQLDKFGEALASYDRALELNPNDYEALQNWIGLLFQLRRYPEASKAISRLLEEGPGHPFALGLKLYALMLIYDWTGHSQNRGRVVELVRNGGCGDAPFPFLAVSASAADQLRCAQVYTAAKHPPVKQAFRTIRRYCHDKIRVAYLSPDFREHPVSGLMVQIFETHDRNRFETVAVSFGLHDGSEMESRVRAAFDRFLDVRGQKDDAEVARQLRNMEIDIAVDLAGHTTDSRLGIFAHRPAPVQVNYLGFPGTTGADYIDYILADDYVIPEDSQNFYSEQVVYLPDCFQANDDKKRIGDLVPQRAQVGLPESGFVFCSFNNSFKCNPEIFAIWVRLLKRFPGGVLWILGDSSTAKDNLRREASRRGIDPGRLVFAFRLPYENHLARMRLADLFLDTFPFNAGTTASDALWAGVPVLTCSGEAFASRMAGSLLRAVGLPELIATSLEEYEALAVELASTPSLLADLRAKLAQNRATYPLFNTKRFCRHLESAYATMWKRYQRGEKPASFAVRPKT